jgi:AcrR family transcriptional regulator
LRLQKRRYPTKAALFLAALVPPYVDADAIINAETEGATPQAALAEIGLRLLVYFRKHIPIVTQLMSHPLISMQDITAHFKSNAAMELTQALARYLAREHTRGILRANNPLATASLLVSAIHSLALFEMMEFHGGQDLEHAVGLFVNALWSGLAPAGEQCEISEGKNCIMGGV